MSKRNNKMLDVLDEKFANYYKYNREIAIRKEELKMNEADENFGGGRSNIVNKTLENQVIKEMSDPYIYNRELWKKAIRETLEEQSKEVRELIEEKYWGPHSWMSWSDYAIEKNYSTASMYRMRQKVLMEFGRKIGEI